MVRRVQQQDQTLGPGHGSEGPGLGPDPGPCQANPDQRSQGAAKREQEPEGRFGGSRIWTRPLDPATVRRVQDLDDPAMVRRDQGLDPTRFWGIQRLVPMGSTCSPREAKEPKPRWIEPSIRRVQRLDPPDYGSEGPGFGPGGSTFTGRSRTNSGWKGPHDHRVSMAAKKNQGARVVVDSEPANVASDQRIRANTKASAV